MSIFAKSGNNMAPLEKLKRSSHELSSPASVAICGMLLALRIVLGYYANFTLAAFPGVKFSLVFIPTAICGMILGPVPTAIMGGCGDMLSFFLNSTGGAYFPGWTINAALSGLVYGMLLYKNNATLPRVIISKLIITIFVELLLGTFWLTVQYGFPYFEYLAARALKQLVTTPFEIIVIFSLVSVVKKAKLVRAKT